MEIVAIDPGPERSAYITWNGKFVLNKGIVENQEMESLLLGSIEMTGIEWVVIEQVVSYGMPVGFSVFETVYYSGRFSYAAEMVTKKVDRMPRREVKLHLCGQVRAKDSNIIQALIDRFAPMERNKGKGTKSAPGFFYGFKKDIWQAAALAVTWWDLKQQEAK